MIEPDALTYIYFKLNSDRYGMISLHFQFASGIVIVLYWPGMTGAEAKIRAKAHGLDITQGGDGVFRLILAE